MGKKKQVTIDDFKSQGLRVAMKHHERQDGGFVTLAGIIDENNKTVTIGVAKCNPSDSFSRKKGRMIALGRAAKPGKADVLRYENDEQLDKILAEEVFTLSDFRANN